MVMWRKGRVIEMSEGKIIRRSGKKRRQYTSCHGCPISNPTDMLQVAFQQKPHLSEGPLQLRRFDRRSNKWQKHDFHCIGKPTKSGIEKHKTLEIPKFCGRKRFIQCVNKALLVVHLCVEEGNHGESKINKTMVMPANDYSIQKQTNMTFQGLSHGNTFFRFWSNKKQACNLKLSSN